MNEHHNLQLKERNLSPTKEALEPILGKSYAAYEALQYALPDLDIEQNWQWYTPYKVWCAKGQYFWVSIRGARKEKVLYWLYVYSEYFCVAVWFKEKNRDELLKSCVSDKTKKMIYDAGNKMGLATFPVLFKIVSEEELIDVYTLIDCKKKMEAK